MTGPIVVVGDALLDRDVEGSVERLSPEAPVPVVDELFQRARPGGAALAAALAAADGRRVVLVTALGADASGRVLARLIEEAGVEAIDLGLAGPTPEKVRFLAEDRLLLRVDRGACLAAVGPLSHRGRDAIRAAAAVLVADYGRGVAARNDVRAELRAAAVRVPLVWDPHPAGAEPVAATRLVTPNRSEAAMFLGERLGDAAASTADRARRLRMRWRVSAVAVTLGREGAVLAERGDEPVHVPAIPAAGGDPCGAGDRFASAAATSLADGASTSGAVRAAVDAASAFVAAGGAGAVGLPPRASLTAFDLAASRRSEEVISRVRAAGGTIVATGGCFDLLHAGHVSMLEAARRLGDCLVVCLNSDDSIRRLKGPDRPLVPEDDRAAVLQALAAVDAVVLFDEDTPEAVLERLRPDVWAKGGDYAIEELPEARVVESWGGRAVILAYVRGRSTTRLIEEAQCLGAD